MPWEFTTENGRTTASLDAYRIYARLHMRLFPYVWSYAKQIVITGRPIARPYGLTFAGAPHLAAAARFPSFDEVSEFPCELVRLAPVATGMHAVDEERRRAVPREISAKPFGHRISFERLLNRGRVESQAVRIAEQVGVAQPIRILEQKIMHRPEPSPKRRRLRHSGRQNLRALGDCIGELGRLFVEFVARHVGEKTVSPVPRSITIGPRYRQSACAAATCPCADTLV